MRGGGSRRECSILSPGRRDEPPLFGRRGRGTPSQIRLIATLRRPRRVAADTGGSIFAHGAPHRIPAVARSAFHRMMLNVERETRVARSPAPGWTVSRSLFPPPSNRCAQLFQGPLFSSTAQLEVPGGRKVPARLDLCVRPLDLILVWCHHENPGEVLLLC